MLRRVVLVATLVIYAGSLSASDLQKRRADFSGYLSSDEARSSRYLRLFKVAAVAATTLINLPTAAATHTSELVACLANRQISCSSLKHARGHNFTTTCTPNTVDCLGVLRSPQTTLCTLFNENEIDQAAFERKFRNDCPELMSVGEPQFTSMGSAYAKYAVEIAPMRCTDVTQVHVTMYPDHQAWHNFIPTTKRETLRQIMAAIAAVESLTDQQYWGLQQHEPLLMPVAEESGFLHTHPHDGVTFHYLYPRASSNCCSAEYIARNFLGIPDKQDTEFNSKSRVVLARAAFDIYCHKLGLNRESLMQIPQARALIAANLRPQYWFGFIKYHDLTDLAHKLLAITKKNS